MVDRARRRTSILLGVAVVVAAVVGIGLARGPSSESSSGMTRLALVDGSVQTDVTDRTYISVRGKRPATLGKPMLVEGRQVTALAVDKDPKAQGRAVLYGVDPTGTITDVMVLSRIRDIRGRLAPLQWLVSKSGVELIWPASGKRPWTVKRADEIVDKQAHGHYVDTGPVSLPTRYEVERADPPVTVTYKGKTSQENGSTTHVLILPAYDDHLVGRSFEQSVRDGSVPSSPFKTAVAAGDVEVAIGFEEQWVLLKVVRKIL